MTIAYFDCFSGISGDMTLGALVDAGVPIESLRAELEKLNVSGYEITALKVMRAGVSATKVHVCLDEKEQPVRYLAEIRRIIGDSLLSSAIQEKSIKIFEQLARAEARVHGTTPDRIHFHEVGAIDAIIDIVGSVIGLDMLGIDSIAGSPVNVGSGLITTAHGTLPIPAPATAELLKGIPTYGSSVSFELTTPTGAVILSTLCASFGLMPRMKVDRIAYGAGGKDIAGQPNVLRLMIGEQTVGYDEDASVVIETNIDDMNPQVYDYLIEKLMQQGAHDVYLTPIIMKKGRPAILVSVLTDAAQTEAMLDTVFRETSSIGVRIQEVGRKKLTREMREVDTPYGKVRLKLSRRGNEILTVTPEYEDCRKIAAEKQVALKTVIDEARASYSRKDAKKES
ncbi:MAG TPA: nickel pincer cofactor biosynthesis protein LarC [Nitrospirota bacterium]|nr:nickel pincer cofactor biosynthesis protein LarC [Nitrospirota bacterium]